MAASAKCRVEIVRDVASLRARLAEWRRAGETIALVPTMGALHAGHISLVHEAAKHARRVVMSIFVNPAQFALSEDFGSYPRAFEPDAAQFTAARGDLLFAPGIEEMYGQGFGTMLAMTGPATAGLEDRFRPGHFAGVATVVAKLLNQCRPDVAIFGEKDYQQLKVIERMARDLDFETEILGAPTVRDADGLALSSRNAFLSPKERTLAPCLHAALRQCAYDINEGVAIETALDSARAALAAAGFVMDYFEARHAETLCPIASRGEGPVRLLAAARLGKTRLIDNIAVSRRPPEPPHSGASLMAKPPGQPRRPMTIAVSDVPAAHACQRTFIIYGFWIIFTRHPPPFGGAKLRALLRARLNLGCRPKCGQTASNSQKVSYRLFCISLLHVRWSAHDEVLSCGALVTINQRRNGMKYFWKILMDVYKFARGIIALKVLMFIGTFIWSMYYVSKTIDETRHAPAVVAMTAQLRSPLLHPLPLLPFFMRLHEKHLP